MRDSTRMRLSLKGIAFLLGIAFGVAPTYAYKETTTHRELSRRAFLTSELNDQNTLSAVGIPYLLTRDSISSSLQDGAEAEDGGTRPANHFFNPTYANPEVAGLTTTYPGFNGEASPNWIIDGKGQGIDEHSWKTANKLYYLALKSYPGLFAQTQFASMFRDIGHVIHHIQDMAQPQHTRNDVHCDSVLVCKRAKLAPYDPSAYETYVSDNWHDYDSLRPVTAVYSSNHRSVSFQKAFDFWKSDNPLDEPGLAVFTSQNFVSIGTNFFPCPPRQCNPDAFPSPRASDANFNVFIENESLVEYKAGSKVYVAAEDLTGLYSGALRGEGKFTQTPTNYLSMLKVLLPKAIAYSSGMLNFFFRARIDAQVDAAGLVTILNKGAELPAGTFELWYDMNGVRLPVPEFTFVTKGITSAGGSIPTMIPTMRPVPVSLAAVPGQFVLTFNNMSSPTVDGIKPTQPGDWVVTGATVKLERASAQSGARVTTLLSRLPASQGLARDNSGNFYLLSRQTKNIFSNYDFIKVAPDGTQTIVVRSLCDGSGLGTFSCQASEIKSDVNGDIYFIHGSDIYKWDSTQAPSVNFPGYCTDVVSVRALTGAGCFYFVGFTINYPSVVTIDSSGQIYFGQTTVHRLIKPFKPPYANAFIAGGPYEGVSGYKDGPGKDALFGEIRGLAVANSGEIYVAESTVIRKISRDGLVSTIAGALIFSGYEDGPGIKAQLSEVGGLVVDNNNIIIFTNGNVIRMITSNGDVKTIVGDPITHEAGFVDGVGSAARLDGPVFPIIDSSGTVYVFDSRNYAIRRITR